MIPLTPRCSLSLHGSISSDGIAVMDVDFCVNFGFLLTIGAGVVERCTSIVKLMNL